MTIQEQINISGGDGLALTVAAGARVIANGGIYIGASGGVSSTVTVNGTLTAKGTESDCAVYAGKVVVGNGGLLKGFGKKWDNAQRHEQQWKQKLHWRIYG